MKQLFLLLFLLSFRAIAQPDTLPYDRVVPLKPYYPDECARNYKGTSYLVTQNKKQGVLNVQYQEIIPARYDEISISCLKNGDYLFRTCNLLGFERCFGFCAPDGSVIVEPTYNVSYELPQYPVDELSDIYFLTVDSVSYGVLDHHGDTVVPLMYESVRIYCQQGNSRHPDLRYAIAVFPSYELAREELEFHDRVFYNLQNGRQSPVYTFLEPVDSLIIAADRFKWSVLGPDFKPIYASSHFCQIRPFYTDVDDSETREKGYKALDFRYCDDSLFRLEQYFDAEVVNDRTIPDYVLVGLANIYTQQEIPMVYHALWREHDNCFWAIRYDEPNGKKGELHIYNRKLQKIRTFRFSENTGRFRNDRTIRIFKDAKGKEVGLDENGNIVP